MTMNSNNDNNSNNGNQTHKDSHVMVVFASRIVRSSKVVKR